MEKLGRSYCRFADKSRLSVDSHRGWTHNIAMSSDALSKANNHPIERTIELTIEPTPSPASLVFRFQGARPFVATPVEYLAVHETDTSPLAAKVFGFPWTQSVLLGPDFVSVTKQDWVEWDVLAKPLGNMLLEHILAGLPLFEELADSPQPSDGQQPLPTDSDLVRQIKTVLSREIRPALAFDGGDVHFIDFANGQLMLKFKGACSGCPSKSVTLKQGIEVRLRELFPEIQEVIGN